MRLILVRHGETHANFADIIVGATESDLNETGKNQARRVAERLSGEHFHAAYSSDQSRARQTAEAILVHHPNLTLSQRPELRERHYGVLEGKPDHAFAEALKASGVSRFNFRPEGGEHYDDVRLRLARFHAELLLRHAGKTVLIVAHSGTLGVYLLEILKKPNEDIIHYRNHPNTAVTIVEYDENGIPSVPVLKDASHLSGLTP